MIVARWFLLISGPRVRVPGGAPNFERQIVRFGVLSFYVGKWLHTFCTPFAQPAFLCIKKEDFYANRTLVNSLRSSASISRMASRIALPVRSFLLSPAVCFPGVAAVLAGVRSWVIRERTCCPPVCPGESVIHLIGAELFQSVFVGSLHGLADRDSATAIRSVKV